MSLTSEKAIEVTNREMAQITGLGVIEIYCLHPEDFGIPRDYHWTGHAIVYTAGGLARLIEAMRAAGREDAALRLEKAIEVRQRLPRAYWWEQF